MDRHSGLLYRLRSRKKAMKGFTINTSRRFLQMLAALLFLAIPAGLIFVFSDYPYAAHSREDALLKFTFKHAGKPVAECRERTPEELARLPAHMRKVIECDRTRHPVEIEILLDGERLIAKTYPPTGLRMDGASSAYETFPLTPGSHRISIGMRDSGRQEDFDYRYEHALTFEAGRVVVLDFDEREKRFVAR